MTQAINLANFSNSLDTSGGVPPTQLNAPVPLSKGGTNGTTAATARTNLGSTAVGDAVFIAANAAAARTAIGTVIGTDVPSPTGTGASGTWGINISGNAGSATTATTATTATYVTTSNSYMLATDSGNAARSMTAVLQPGTWQLVVDGRFGISDSSTYSFSSSQSASVSGGATATASVSVSFSRQGGSGYGRIIHGSGVGITTITVSTSPATVTFTLNAASLGGGYYEGGKAHLNKIA